MEEYWFSPLAAHVETSIVEHLENASSQTEESKIAANFQTGYAKQFLSHKLCPNLNEQSLKMSVWSSRVKMLVSEFRNKYTSLIF